MLQLQKQHLRPVHTSRTMMGHKVHVINLFVENNLKSVQNWYGCCLA
jgi:hypothetical protein